MERGTKTRYRVEGQQERLFPPRMYATGNSRCPVSIFKKMIAHRPPDVNDPFFLATIPSPQGDVWFKKQPMGVGKVGNMMKVLYQHGIFKGKKTHHSARKSMITRLIEIDVLPLIIAQLSGHKSLKSLNSYSHASIAQQQTMSLTISGQGIGGACSGAGRCGGSTLQDITNS